MIKKLKISLNVLLSIFVILTISFAATVVGINIYKNVFVYESLKTKVNDDNQNLDDYLFDVFYNVALYKNSIFNESNLTDFKNSSDKQAFLVDLESNNRLNSDLYYDLALVYDNQYYNLTDQPFIIDTNTLTPLSETENQLLILGKFRYGDDYTLVLGVKNADIYSLFYLQETALISLFDLSYENSFTVIQSAGTIFVSTQNEIVNVNTSNLDLSKRELTLNGRKYIVIASELEASNYFHPDLEIVSFISYSSIYSTIDLMQMIIIIFLVIVFILVGVLSYFMVKRIVRPINALSKEMSNLDLNHEYKPQQHVSTDTNEIYLLEKSYQDMIYRIQDLMKRQQKDYETQRQLELDSLQMQVNPHFLYNSLDMIAWMSKLGNNKNIEEFVILLARFYRLSLHKGAKYIKVSEEIDIIKYYLDIQAKVFPDLFTYEIDCETGICDYLSLKLILQPFVENIIKYAFYGVNHKGNIKIKAYQQDASIVFEIIDNGCGFDVSVLDDKEEKKNGFGIKNVKERLALEYEKNATLQIESVIGNGTKVTVTIPKSF